MVTDWHPVAPNLWLTRDYFVGKLSAVCQPARLTQPSFPLESLTE